jgi:hypothetical protein
VPFENRRRPDRLREHASAQRLLAGTHGLHCVTSRGKIGVVPASTSKPWIASSPRKTHALLSDAAHRITAQTLIVDADFTLPG